MKKVMKKMVSKPVMKKAKNGETVAKRDTIRTEYNKDKELGEVVKRETGAERLKKFYKRDYFGADAAKTKAGKDVRKVLNTVAKVSYTPHALAEMLLLTGSTARANKRDAKAAAAADSTSVKRRMGGKVAKKVAPKMMMMKKMSKKK